MVHGRSKSFDDGNLRRGVQSLKIKGERRIEDRIVGSKGAS